MITILSLWHSASNQFNALRWEQQIGLIALVAAVAALSTYVGLIHYELFIQRSLREEPIPEPEPRVSLHTYCRICREYRVTPDTACEHCHTPLLLFEDAIDMTEHMVRTFPLPPLGQSQAKGFDRGKPAVFFDPRYTSVPPAGTGETPHAQVIQMHRKVN